MKKRILSILLSALMILSFPTVACASGTSPRASDYFGCTDVRAYAEDGGKILIEIDVDATHMMQAVGASYVYIYEQQSDGTYDIVYTFTKEDYPSMVVRNSFFGYVDVTYQGTVGKRYYAFVGCYARDSEGSETLYFTTNSVVASLVAPAA